MKCPNCKELNLVMSERKGIEIDYCPECRGIWLDRGELDKIIEKSAVEKAPQPEAYESRERATYSQPHPHNSSHHSSHYPPKRKKSFLEDLFD